MKIKIPRSKIASFCQKWLITELAVFGSAIRDDFTQQSDVDVLVTFKENAPWSLWDFVDMQDELKAILGREVDIVEKNALRNPFRKHEILTTSEVVYAA